jgi:hypothetical protein
LPSAITGDCASVAIEKREEHIAVAEMISLLD